MIPDLLGYDPPQTRPYRPSNGTSGEIFCARFCYRCKHDSEEAPCEILGRTLIYSIDDPEYPKEWVQDEAHFPNNNPRCTAFERAS